MAALLGARTVGAERIVAIDISQDKLELARTIGATDAFFAAEDGVADAIRDATGGGVKHVIELAGSTAAN